MTLRDLVLLLSEPAARWLLAMLEAIIDPGSEAYDPEGQAAESACETLAHNHLAVRIQVNVQVYDPGEIGRPRWQGRELAVAAGDLLMIFSASAARWFLKALGSTVDEPSG